MPVSDLAGEHGVRQRVERFDDLDEVIEVFPDRLAFVDPGDGRNTQQRAKPLDLCLSCPGHSFSVEDSGNLNR